LGGKKVPLTKQKGKERGKKNQLVLGTLEKRRKEERKNNRAEKGTNQVNS